MKSICFIFNKAPYGEHSGRELLDICLMSCAFDMPITVIFQSAGVLQLLESQTPEILAIKNHSKTFKALELYGVENILIDSESIDQYKISKSEMLAIGELADQKRIAQAIQSSAHTLMM